MPATSLPRMWKPRPEERDDAARDYVRELLLDEGAEEGDGGCLYRCDEGGRGEEEFVDEVRLGDDEGDDE